MSWRMSCFSWLYIGASAVWSLAQIQANASKPHHPWALSWKIQLAWAERQLHSSHRLRTCDSVKAVELMYSITIWSWRFSKITGTQCAWIQHTSDFLWLSWNKSVQDDAWSLFQHSAILSHSTKANGSCAACWIADTWKAISSSPMAGPIRHSKSSLRLAAASGSSWCGKSLILLRPSRMLFVILSTILLISRGPWFASHSGPSTTEKGSVGVIGSSSCVCFGWILNVLLAKIGRSGGTSNPCWSTMHSSLLQCRNAHSLVPRHTWKVLWFSCCLILIRIFWSFGWLWTTTISSVLSFVSWFISFANLSCACEILSLGPVRTCSAWSKLPTVACAACLIHDPFAVLPWTLTRYLCPNLFTRGHPKSWAVVTNVVNPIMSPGKNVCPFSFAHSMDSKGWFSKVHSFNLLHGSEFTWITPPSKHTAIPGMFCVFLFGTRETMMLVSLRVPSSVNGTSSSPKTPTTSESIFKAFSAATSSETWVVG